ncbi:hypothetical protein NDU88_005319 [Pleurodeles waltl]|uniref:Uncharacterized protein n=1 Tax=Pleurodeles waltl TaxID=8319 RepID=A0AAV7TUH6_PLEWA|nr:hypothetical protein NDU88_005319 [Pleurodeles waltl]
MGSGQGNGPGDLMQVFSQRKRKAAMPFCLTQRHYERSEKAGSLLELHLRQQDISHTIPVTWHEDRLVLTHALDILESFVAYCETLFLSHNVIPCLMADQVLVLETEFTPEEIQEAIDYMLYGKGPRLDGYPSEYYKANKGMLAPLFCKAYSEASSNKYIQGLCDGSDRSDPHTIATGAATAWDDPEVTPRSTLPIGSGLSPREPVALKGQDAEFRGAWMVGEEKHPGGIGGSNPKAREDPENEETSRTVGNTGEQSLTRPKNHRSPNSGRRPRAREADPYDPPRFRRSVAKPAPDDAESRTVFRSCGGDDDSPSYQGNGDAGNHLGNPDIRDPESTEKDDELCKQGAEEGKNTDNEKERSKETEDGSRNGNSEVPLKIDGQPWARKRVETRELRHVPGGTWLTKVKSHLSKILVSHIGDDWFLELDCDQRKETPLWTDSHLRKQERGKGTIPLVMN